MGLAQGPPVVSRRPQRPFPAAANSIVQSSGLCKGANGTTERHGHGVPTSLTSREGQCGARPVLSPFWSARSTAHGRDRKYCQIAVLDHFGGCRIERCRIESCVLDAHFETRVQSLALQLSVPEPLDMDHSGTLQHPLPTGVFASCYRPGNKRMAEK